MTQVEDPKETASRRLSEAGYSKGGEVAVAKRVVRRAIRQHENAEHGGKHENLKLKSGGKVHGSKSESRPDRRARGGGLHGKKGGPTVNIKVGGGEEKAKMAAQQGLRAGVALGARMAGAKGPGAPMGAPGAGGPPPGGMPMPPPGADAPPGGGAPLRRGGEVRRAHGGKIEREQDEDASSEPDDDNDDKERRAHGGSVEVRAHSRRKAGGRCE